MTITVADANQISLARPRLWPLAIGLGVYALLLISGDRLLNDPDTLWQVTIGQWIIDHRAVPWTDSYSFTMAGQPWISTQWLAQVAFAASYQLTGWAGPVVMTAAALGGTFYLLARLLGARLNDTATVIFAAAALALTAPHMLARPHVLAMPVMLAWVGALVGAADRRSVPSLWTLPLITLWANLHGGFVFGIALVAPFALDAVLSAERPRRVALLLRWALFGVLALAAGCLTPYGWDSILASRKILSLGEALSRIGEWAPEDFSKIGVLEITLLGGLGLALLRGVTLPPVRILILLGLIHMALSHSRNLELLALVAPLVLAAPLAAQCGIAAPAGAPSSSRGLTAALLALAVGGTLAFATWHSFAPRSLFAPQAAVAELKRLGAKRVFNDYNFGGYLIANGLPTFIDGRTELFGETLVVDHDDAVRLRVPDKLFRLLDAYAVDATLLIPSSPAAKLLDRTEGWQKVYADDLAVIHQRKPGATPSPAPTVTPPR